MDATPKRLTNLFINTKYPAEGLIALRLYVKGKPAVVTIDDYLPFYYGSPAFANRPASGAFWGPFIEKAFAKLTGNYENIGGGWLAECWRILNGAPTRFYTMATINNDPNQAFNVI